LLAGILIAFPITLAAFTLLYILARDLVREPRSAQRAVLYLALFPYAFFLQAVYSEAIFLVCALAAFVCAERKRFLAAGVLAGAAMLARPVGPAVLAGVVVLGWRDRARWAALARLSVAPLVFGIFPLLLFLQGRSPMAFLSAEHGWRKYSVLDPRGAALAPLRNVYDGARAAGTGIGDLVSGSSPSAFTIHNVTAFALFVVFLALSAAAWRKLGTAYGVYCAGALAIPNVSQPLAAPLLSFQRFALVLFPCFIVLGALPLGRYAHRGILVASGVGLVTLLYIWTRGEYFVA